MSDFKDDGKRGRRHDCKDDGRGGGRHARASVSVLFRF